MKNTHDLCVSLSLLVSLKLQPSCEAEKLRKSDHIFRKKTLLEWNIPFVISCVMFPHLLLLSLSGLSSRVMLFHRCVYVSAAETVTVKGTRSSVALALSLWPPVSTCVSLSQSLCAAADTEGLAFSFHEFKSGGFFLSNNKRQGCCLFFLHVIFW